MIATPEAHALEAARRIAETELSTPSRIAHGALLAAALTMTTVIVALWLTEPDLPLRTRAVFGVLTTIGAGWSGYAAWVLTERRALFARQRVVAGWLAVSFTSVFTIGAFGIGVAANARAGFAAGGLGLVLFAAGALLLLRARRRLAALTERKCQLEALSAGGAR